MNLIHFPLVYNQPMADYQASRTLRHSLCKYLEPEVAPSRCWFHSYLNPQRPGSALKGAHIRTGDLLHDAMQDYAAMQAGVRPAVSAKGQPIKRTSLRGLIGYEQAEAVQVLRTKLLAIPDVAQAVEEGQPEVSLYAQQYGIDIACRPDLLSAKIEIHWKTMSRMDYLGEQINRLRYIECLAWYRRVRRQAGLTDIPQVMYLCETKPPYEIRIVKVSPYFLDQADVYGHQAITRFKRFYSQFGEGPWPDLQKPVDIYTASAGSPAGNAIAMPYSFDRRIAI